MTDRRDPPADPRSDFVVETRMKPDGRLIHYYEWPDRPTEPGTSKPDKVTGSERRRV